MQEEKLDMIVSAVQRLEASNTNMLESVNKVLQVNIVLKNDLESLTKRQTKSKANLSHFPQKDQPRAGTIM